MRGNLRRDVAAVGRHERALFGVAKRDVRDKWAKHCERFVCCDCNHADSGNSCHIPHQHKQHRKPDRGRSCIYRRRGSARHRAATSRFHAVCRVYVSSGFGVVGMLAVPSSTVFLRQLNFNILDLSDSMLLSIAMC